MPNQNKLIDAVKTAKLIHDGDYSSLRNKSFLIRDNIKNKKGVVPHPRDKTMKKSRMDRLEESIAKLAEQMNARFDNLENDVKGLKQDVKDINARLDGIDARLDYNGLKKLPEGK